LELTKELQEKINLILAMNRAGRVVMANDGSAAIGGDATGNTFNLGPVFQLSSHEKPLLEEVVAIHNFDLSDLVDDCLDHLLMNPRGVVGFGLSCNIPRLLASVCERLRIRLDCDCAEVKDQIALDRSFAASIDDVVNDFLLTHKVAKIPNTIFSVQTFENESALAFWRHMKAHESYLPAETRLILIMVVEEDFPFPADIYKLPSPTFRRAHMDEFLRKVVSTRKKDWGDATVSKVAYCWVQSLIGCCTTEGIFYQKPVYQYIKLTLDGFKSNADPDKFLKFLEEFEELV
jgi:hypothetical protein